MWCVLIIQLTKKYALNVCFIESEWIDYTINIEYVHTSFVNVYANKKKMWLYEFCFKFKLIKFINLPQISKFVT